GDHELGSALFAAGFEVFDYNMLDILEERASIRGMDLLALAGGFADGDVPETAVGWVKMIQDNPIAAEQFEEFRQRPDTLVFGVCNGFQVLTRMGWLPGYDIPLKTKPQLQQNKSGRFQSRLVSVRFENCDNVFLEGMAGTIFPQVWIAHGEGYPYFPDPDVMDQVRQDRLVAMSFVDFDGNPTEVYPLNPNGSPLGITGLSSPNGRILGIMPHLERSFQLWQMPWLPKEWRNLEASPCLRVFQNAYAWLMNHEQT
ncbi:MAG: putative phosphoribosylformylglycinamidine synthase, chloroplastic/mitochondrial, partial [Candidatus Berkelbacteria bacterium]|nr:putative phosphoribosylformylglycinamidine synthase, chloroplastic/mitochondrial [Candidatus Berkelbacteria bacterium]